MVSMIHCRIVIFHDDVLDIALYGKWQSFENGQQSCNCFGMETTYNVLRNSLQALMSNKSRLDSRHW